jgi:non-homologous end joining protein Ku
MIKCDQGDVQFSGTVITLTAETMTVFESLIDMMRREIPKEYAEPMFEVLFNFVDEKLHGEKEQKPNHEEAFKAAEFLNNFFDSIEKANK